MFIDIRLSGELPPMDASNAHIYKFMIEYEKITTSNVAGLIICPSLCTDVLMIVVEAICGSYDYDNQLRNSELLQTKVVSLPLYRLLSILISQPYYMLLPTRIPLPKYRLLSTLISLSKYWQVSTSISIPKYRLLSTLISLPKYRLLSTWISLPTCEKKLWKLKNRRTFS